MSLDVREFWNFNDPLESEKQFRAILKRKTLSHDEKLEVWAQIARTYSLRSDCPQCHTILDEFWDDAMASGSRAKTCFELERGRAYRSGGDVPKSIPYFQIAAESDEDDLKVDAMHMLAIIAKPGEATAINLEALAFAQASPHPWAQRWQGTLCNNLGWTSFDEGKFEEAVGYFQRALDQRIQYGVESTIDIAKWCLARGYRAMGELDKAFDIQSELASKGHGGMSEEELGEICLAQNDTAKAMSHFQKALADYDTEFGPESKKVEQIRATLQSLENKQ